jgi:GNAT superfamily N-acetyltransferase
VPDPASLSTDVRVRRATAADYSVVSDLLVAALGRPVVGNDSKAQAAVFDRHLVDADRHLIVAELTGRVVGVASVSFRERLNWPTLEAWLSELAVERGFRRQGVARALLHACIELARSRSCHLLRLECRFDRTEAHALYEAMGFTAAGYDYKLAL